MSKQRKSLYFFVAVVWRSERDREARTEGRERDCAGRGKVQMGEPMNRPPVPRTVQRRTRTTPTRRIAKTRKRREREINNQTKQAKKKKGGGRSLTVSAASVATATTRASVRDILINSFPERRRRPHSTGAIIGRGIYSSLLCMFINYCWDFNTNSLSFASRKCPTVKVLSATSLQVVSCPRRAHTHTRTRLPRRPPTVSVSEASEADAASDARITTKNTHTQTHTLCAAPLTSRI